MTPYPTETSDARIAAADRDPRNDPDFEPEPYDGSNEEAQGPSDDE
jgi:hypothetical protein